MRSIEWCILLAVLGILSTQTHSLKCRGDDEEDDDFNEVARMCMRNTSTNNRYSTRRSNNNASNNRNRDNNNNANGCGDSSNNGGSSGNNRNGNNRNNDGSYGTSSSNNNNNGGRNNGDSGGTTWTYGGGWQQSSSNRGSSQNGASSDSDYYGSSRYRKTKNSDRGRNNYNYSMEFSGNSPLENVEPCIIQCIFSEMQMLDDAGYPEKSSVKNIMTRKIRNSEVRDFIEDSIEECYDLLDADNRRDRCEYSKSLALCLEEKGRKTCEDWDAPNKNGG